MSLFARNIANQLVKKHSQCFIRHLSKTPHILSSKTYDHKSHQSENYSEWLKKSLVISLGLCAGIVSYFNNYLSSAFPKVQAATISASTSTSTANASTPASRRAQFNFLADVVEIAAKSLVFIEIQDIRRMDYFSGKPAAVSNGSGFIVDSDGLILTNAHVVVNKPRTVVSVKLNDGRIFMGVVEAVDPISDLATVRIQCKKLPALKLGISANARAGEFVVALGSPLSLSNTVTAGVISSTLRNSEELGLRGRDINYIQTDASITFGNSGGPLVNLDGEAIGINSMKVTAGISFAIPIDYAKHFLTLAEEKVKKGKGLVTAPVRRYMGITMLTLTPSILAELKQRGSQIPDQIQSGILVWKVIVGSPAHSSGLMAGDIILNINGKDVTQSADIYEILASNEKVLEMIVLRNGQIHKIAVTPDDPE